jgi:hypothetical protein
MRPWRSARLLSVANILRMSMDRSNNTMVGVINCEAQRNVERKE